MANPYYDSFGTFFGAERGAATAAAEAAVAAAKTTGTQAPESGRDGAPRRLTNETI